MTASLHPWTFGWDALVAIGTLGLAAATFVLGFVAIRGNRLARRGVEIAQAELKASMFPLIEAVPIELDQRRAGASRDSLDYTNVDGTDDGRLDWKDEIDINGTSNGVFCSIPVKNVGHGIVRIADVKPRALSVPDVLWTEGASTRALIPVGEYARLQFRLSGVRDEIYAEVLYSDISGEQGAFARFYLKRDVDDSGALDLFSEGTATYRVGEDEPVATTGDARVAAPQPSPLPGTPT